MSDTKHMFEDCLKREVGELSKSKTKALRDIFSENLEKLLPRILAVIMFILLGVLTVIISIMVGAYGEKVMQIELRKSNNTSQKVKFQKHPKYPYK